MWRLNNGRGVLSPPSLRAHAPLGMRQAGRWKPGSRGARRRWERLQPPAIYLAAKIGSWCRAARLAIRVWGSLPLVPAPGQRNAVLLT